MRVDWNSISFWAAFVSVAIAVAMVSWTAQRKLNYKYSYKEKTTSLIKEIVKPECLTIEIKD